jgi:hypothetical protein
VVAFELLKFAGQASHLVADHSYALRRQQRNRSLLQ